MQFSGRCAATWSPAAAGFRIDGWSGDWDRTAFSGSSPEVVVLARAD